MKAWPQPFIVYIQDTNHVECVPNGSTMATMSRESTFLNRQMNFLTVVARHGPS